MEDTFEVQSTNLIQIGRRVLGGFEVSILAQGGAKKKWGDLGIAFGLKENHRHISRCELFYWLIDPYYNSKKDFDQDSYSSNPNSYGIDCKQRFEGLAFSLFYEKDTPFTWKRLSQAYLYSYEKSFFETTLTYDFSSDTEVSLRLQQSNKLEQKKFYTTISSSAEDPEVKVKTVAPTELPTYSKLGKRTNAEIELAAQFTLGDSTANIGLLTITSNADYISLTSFSDADRDLLEPTSPKQSRSEQALYATRYTPTESHSGYQLGLFLNNWEISEGETEILKRQNLEIKLQTAYLVGFDESLSMLLNISWDVDQTVDEVSNGEFPKLWGGGNIQFSATL